MALSDKLNQHKVTRVMVTFTASNLAWLDDQASMHGLTRSKVIAALIADAKDNEAKNGR